MKNVPSFVLVSLLSFVAASSIAGCVQDDVGVRCAIEGSGELGHTRFELRALECEERVCISYQSGESGARCTRPCEEDSDCPSDSIAGCEGGFVCRVGVAIPGSVQCCKFCVCQQDVPAGEDPLKAACAGRATKCPNI